MKYSDLLKTHEWQEFRRHYIDSKRNSDGEVVCTDCEREIRTGLHVHHRAYYPDRLPWEYDFSDLRLICKFCHDQIHETESQLSALVRSLPPHVCYEINDFLAELEGADARDIKIIFARAKNEARMVKDCNSPA